MSTTSMSTPASVLAAPLSAGTAPATGAAEEVRDPLKKLVAGLTAEPCTTTPSMVMRSPLSLASPSNPQTPRVPAGVAPARERPFTSWSTSLPGATALRPS